MENAKMRSVEELKALADKLALAAAIKGSVVIVAIADVDPETGTANHYVSYGGGMLAVRGLVERVRSIVDHALGSEKAP
jgi:hypothetical protein